MADLIETKASDPVKPRMGWYLSVTGWDLAMPHAAGEGNLCFQNHFVMASEISYQLIVNSENGV